MKTEVEESSGSELVTLYKSELEEIKFDAMCNAFTEEEWKTLQFSLMITLVEVMCDPKKSDEVQLVFDKVTKRINL